MTLAFLQACAMYQQQTPELADWFVRTRLQGDGFAQREYGAISLDISSMQTIVDRQLAALEASRAVDDCVGSAFS